MEKIQLEIVALSSSQAQTGSYALVLGEKNGTRRLPIIIGMFEAQSIAIQLEDIKPKRPMTHDLFKSFAEHFTISVEEVFIYDLKEGVFYAKLVTTNGSQSFEIDSRPSDAIAIGIRFGINIYTTEQILSEAGIVLSDVDEEGMGEKVEKQADSSKHEPFKERIKKEDSDTLNSMLDDALKNEEYEKAALIRDELNRRN